MLSQTGNLESPELKHFTKCFILIFTNDSSWFDWKDEELESSYLKFGWNDEEAVFGWNDEEAVLFTK
ncbi:hypothetical protein YC2023_089202 [Brassica napus]